MSIEIMPTPVVTGESAKRLTRLMFASRHKKTGLTPVPHLAELTAKILAFQEERRKERAKKQS